MLQAFDLLYGSQISPQTMELIAGMKLEDSTEFSMMDGHIRNYKLALLKPLLNVNNFTLCKTLPKIFSSIRAVTADDLKGLEKPEHPLKLGYLRSGSKELAVPIYVDGKEVFAHHILITATTGRGKSNLLKCILWDLIDKPYCSALVLDPHDEYYGRTEVGMKDHPANSKVTYYTPKNPPAGSRTFKINVKDILPQHFQGVIDFSDPQWQALYMFKKQFGDGWIEAILLEKPLNIANFHEDTTAVVRRKVMGVLNITYENEKFISRGAFSIYLGDTTINDICDDLEQGKTVIVDTSLFSGEVEILVGSVICSEMLKRYRR
ncbi:MAG TPA: ATP-binding protein, partial [Candidatus Nanoarchaeia archaeon]|nr:ATP-binding protein [Candidatus Nanoarchaeia archaeon]